MLEGIISAMEAAAKNTAGDESDYTVDGLLYCGKCRTPKQCRITLDGMNLTPFCLCKCESDRREREEAEMKRRREEEKIAEYRRAAFPTENMRNMTFSGDDGGGGRVFKIARNYVEHFPEMLERGKGLIFYGNIGTGKTFLAASVVNALVDRGYPCLMTDFPRLEKTLSSLRDGRQSYLDGLERYKLLVIDDLARERDTGYMSEIVEDVINTRYQSGLPLIVTTNLTAEDIKNPKDISKRRPYSRLLEMCLPLELTGDDRRREKLKRNYAELKGILGL